MSKVVKRIPLLRRPFEIFKLEHVLADWNPALHSYQYTDVLGYSDVYLRLTSEAGVDLISKMKVGFLIECYDNIKVAGFYATCAPQGNMIDGQHLVSSDLRDAWSLHPSLEDAMEVLFERITKMEAEGWIVLKRTTSTKTRYDFTELRTQARL